MDLKIQVSNGFEDYCLEKSSEHDFISVHTTNIEMNDSSIIRNASGALKIVNQLPGYMLDINYPLCQAITCCYRQDFHSLNSIMFTNCKIKAVANKWNMDAYVGALGKVNFMPESTMDNFIFYNNIRSGLQGGYVCMDLFLDTVDVNAKLKSIEQKQSEYGVEILMNETDMNKVARRFVLMYEFIKNLNNKANAEDIDSIIGNIDAFAIENNDNYTDFLLILNTELSLLYNSLFHHQDSVDINKLVILNKEKFENSYIDRISNGVFDLKGIDNKMLKDCDNIIFELFTMCADMCYAKQHRPFIILNMSRDVAKATSENNYDNFDSMASLLLPAFSEFVRSISDGGIVIYTGVKSGSKTEQALIEYERTLGII